MIQFNEVTIRRGVNVLFENANFILPSKAKVGLVGQNGTGKSSLFAVICHQLAIDHGDYHYPKHLRIAHIEQETPALTRSAIEYVIDGDAILRKLEKQLVDAENANNHLKIAEIHQHLHAVDAYTVTARASRLLNGLGFCHKEFNKNVSTFSGGWRMRLNLAQALIKPSDLLLLDEPTNHLDLNTIIWLERYLQQYAGMLIIISHDRNFLDKVTSHTLHINNLNIDYYIGNYSSFEKQRGEKLALQESMNKKITAKRQHLQHFIDRFKAKASKARQAQSRVKALEKLVMIQVAQIDSPFSFHFDPAPNCSSPLLETKDLQLGYSDQHIQLKCVNLTLNYQDRIGLVGANGMGKSTLLKSICGSLSPQIGNLKLASNVKIGYFAQHQIDELNEYLSPFDHILSSGKQASEQKIRNFLGGFNFHGDRVFEPLQQFSGGEKARFALANIIWLTPNFLILDEPTNHLDIDMCDALNLALQEFNGCLILVSHNRDLLNSCTNELWVAANQTITPFKGNLDEYIDQFTNTQISDKTIQQSALEKSNNYTKKMSRKQAANIRITRAPLLKTLKKHELNLEKLQHELIQVEEVLADSDIYNQNNQQQLENTLIQQASLKQKIEQSEEEVLFAMDEIEEFDKNNNA